MREAFFLYHIVSLFLGFAATAVVVVLQLKTKNPRLAAYLLSNLFVALIVMDLTYELFCQITGQDHGLRVAARESIHFLCCGLCFSVPRMAGPGRVPSWARTPERTFAAAGLVLGVLLAATYLVPVLRSWFLPVYVLVYSTLTLAVFYFGISLGQGPRHLQRTLKVLRLTALGLLPAFVVTDFFGWLIPGLPLPPGFSLLPVYFILMSLVMLVSATQELLDPTPTLRSVPVHPAFARQFGLTPREAEIAPLVLQCLSYKEIAERLFISPGTVRTHLTHIYQKTGTRTRLELSGLLQRHEAKHPSPT